MKKSDIKTASLEDLEKLSNAGKPSSALKVATIPELPTDFWDDAVLVDYNVRKVPVNIRVDEDILEFFKASGKGHLTRMHAVLRSYVEAQKSKETS